MYICMKSNILLGTDRNLTLFSLHTLVGKSFHFCQNLHPVILRNVGSGVTQRERHRPQPELCFSFLDTFK